MIPPHVLVERAGEPLALVSTEHLRQLDGFGVDHHRLQDRAGSVDTIERLPPHEPSGERQAPLIPGHQGCVGVGEQDSAHPSKTPLEDQTTPMRLEDPRHGVIWWHPCATLRLIVLPHAMADAHLPRHIRPYV
jgi:hypothetical protein